LSGPEIVDAGPLVALLNRRDAHHEWAKSRFVELTPPLLTCEAVLSEACFLLRDIPSGPEAVLRLVARGTIVPQFDVLREIASLTRLVSRYASLPMSLADACLVRMAEIHDGSTILTIDSHFTIYRKNGRQVIPLIRP